MTADSDRDPAPRRGASAGVRDARPAVALQAGRGRWFARGWLVGALLWATANSLRLFDDVLLGIFVCWTPQCSLAALLLTAGLLAAPDSHFAASGADRHASL